MNAPLTLERKPEIIYPESDGQPIADNTKQFHWIYTIFGNLEALFIDDPMVFVAADLLWYPVEGEPTIRLAPDTLTVFGRPKGHRGSYLQWREENIPPQVVFEIWSPGNRLADFVRKLAFYEKYGVEEFYLYNPDNGDLTGFQRREGKLQEIPAMVGWVSPRLGIRFEMENGELILFRPDGRKFFSLPELDQQRQEALKRAEQATQWAERETQRANAAEAELARLRALLEKGQEPRG
jgi:Uma2 family endonuclease